MLGITTGGYNTAVGIQTLYRNQTGTGNVAIGKGALEGSPGESHSNNTAVGFEALNDATTGHSNVAVGYQAGDTLTNGTQNVLVGMHAGGGSNMASVSDNVLIGYQAGLSNAASENTMVGHQSGYNTGTAGNTFLGYRTGFQYNNQGSNVLIGYTAGTSFRGGESVIIGHQAGNGLATTDLTTSLLVGKDAGRFAKGQMITSMGWRAGTYISGSYNTFVGGFAGYGSTTGAPYGTGTANTTLGAYSAYKITGGSDNVLVGYAAGIELTSGDYNIAIGRNAGDAITTGANNIAIGYGADVSAADAINEIVIGNSSHTGSFKMGSGANNGTAQTQGAQVLAQSLYLKQIGLDHDKSGTDGVGDMENVLLTLHGAYDDDAIGGRGIAMSFKMQDESTNVGEMGRISVIPRSGNMNSNLSAYGTEMYFYNSVGGTLTKQMELSGGDSHACVGIFGNASTIAALRVYNDGNNANRDGILIHAGADDGSGTTAYIDARDGDGDQVGHISNTSGTFALTDVSDKRLKKDIVDTTIKGVDTINKIKVRDFEWIKSGDKSIGGFIAQELVEAFPSAVTGEDGAMEDILDKDGNKTGERIKPMGVSRENLVPVLIKGVQELSTENKQLKDKLNDLEIFIKDKLGDK